MGATCGLGLLGLIRQPAGGPARMKQVFAEISVALVGISQAASLFYEVVGDQVYKIEFRYGGPTLGTPTVEIVDDPVRLRAWSRASGAPLSWEDWDVLGQKEINIPNHIRGVVHSGGRYELPHLGTRGVRTYQHKLPRDHGLSHPAAARAYNAAWTHRFMFTVSG